MKGRKRYIGKITIADNPTSAILLLFKLLLVLSITTTPTANVVAQDANFSQYYAAPLYLNPALAGIDPRITVGLNYRSQLKSDLYPNQSSQFSFILPIMGKGNGVNHKGGLGLSAYNEIAGQNSNFKVIGINLAGAYNLYLKQDGSQKFTFAIQGGFINKQIDFTNLTWGSQFDPFVGFDTSIDPSINFLNESTLYPVFNAGLMWYTSLGGEEANGSSAYFGLSAGNINEPDESLLDGEPLKLPRLFKVNAGVDLSINEKITFSPNVLLKYQNGVFQLNGGTYLYYDLANTESDAGPNLTRLVLGAWYRYGDSFIVATGINKNQFTVGFSYDMRISSLRHPDIGSGAYEVSFTYRFKRKEKEATYEHKPRFTI
ncbi:PorP/SprF family type IX secretion system membrane protein [Fulvivirgaceae bacterium BMA12]|uniref:PorP/SprF family type IX secretion system membrane protein n=1 Tax=Agaribacillus aureus TaxID=3051825 RepID=A0ABT8L8H6_9BACT|nr:PorP/SprF family type IX secretion system membrane protein [Fulvivirgaceae bacterium BMA12]